MNKKKNNKKRCAAPKLFAFIALATILSATVSFLSGCNDKKETLENESELYAEYEIHVAVERDLKRIYVTEKVRVTNLTDAAVDELKFDMFAFAYESGAEPSAYFKSEQSKWEKGETLIGGVSVNGLPAETERDGVCLGIKLPEPINSDQTAEIGIAYTLKTPTSPYRYGRNGKTLKLTDFYPVLRTSPLKTETEEYSLIAHPDRYDVALYNVSYSLSKNVSLATNSPIKQVREEGETVIVECAESALRELASVVYADSREICRSSSVGVSSDSETVLGYAESAYTAYSALMGEFPFDALSVVRAPLDEDFVAVSGFVMINEKLSGDRLKNAVLNGVAAEYFGCAASSATDADRWVGEGTAYYLSEYYELLTGNSEGYSSALENDLKLTASVTEEMSKYYPGYAFSPGRALGEYLTVNEYLTTVKCGTALIYERLRNEYGDKKLKKALAALYEYARFNRMTTDEAVTLLSEKLEREAGDLIRSML